MGEENTRWADDNGRPVEGMEKEWEGEVMETKRGDVLQIEKGTTKEGE